MVSQLSSLLSVTDSLCIHDEYKLWIYNVSVLHFHFCADAVANRTISQLESNVTHYLKKWLNLPWSATRGYFVILGLLPKRHTCFPRSQAKFTVLCQCLFWLYRLQELGIQLQLGKMPSNIHCWHLHVSTYHQFQLLDCYSLKQRVYCLARLHLNVKIIYKRFQSNLKFTDSAVLEWSCRTWCLVFIQLSFLLQAASDTLPAEVN